MPDKSLTTRIRNRLRRDSKRLYWRTAPSDAQRRTILFIVGSQRSGTTMLLDMFEKDWRSRTFSEFSSITEDIPDGIRLKPLDDVCRIFASSGEPFIVCKPLVESQRTRDLLEYFPRSRALWTYRDYHDVVSSNVKFFRSRSVKSCRIVVDGEPGHWQSEVVPERALELIRRHYHAGMSPHDAAALMWYARNCLYFEQDLDMLPSVRLWKYDDFVRSPTTNAYQIYAWLKMAPPGRRTMNFVNPRSVGLGQGVTLDAEIEGACRELMDRLDTKADARSAAI
ncbi:MAG: hypothetical protein WD795_12855 [Woeseia sp.]